MGNPFSKPKVAQPAPIVTALPAEAPPIPERTDDQTDALADQQRRKFAGAGGGRASTYLTSSGTSQASSAVRYLGGAAAT